MISVIMTVLNEKHSLQKWFESISGQSVQPEEIVIVDGGSIDGTYEFLENYKNRLKTLNVFQHKGNIASGRNFAIKQAKGDVIAVTDAGCVYGNDWLKKLTEPLVEKRASWSATAFGPWLQADDDLLLYLIAAATTPASFEFTKNWLPSSRSVAFTKDRWITAGGYPEWIPFCEDVLFDQKLLKKEGWPFFVRDPQVFWRPRLSMQKFFLQLFNYTRSEGHANLNVHRQFIRYFVYLSALVILCLSLWFPDLSGLLMFCVAIYIWKFWKRFSSFASSRKWLFKLAGIICLPFIIAIGDLAKMSGYIFGVYEKKTGKIFENNA